MGYSKPKPLRGKHSTDEFESGEESLDVWLKRYARHAEATGSAKVYVTTDDGVCVVGYYALTVGEVGPELATERMKKGQPDESSVPVLLLARLAVDRDHRGQGLDDPFFRMLSCGAQAQLSSSALERSWLTPFRRRLPPSMTSSVSKSPRLTPSTGACSSRT